MNPDKIKFKTMADLYNHVSVENFQRLTDDLLLSLKAVAIIRETTDVKFPVDWSLTYTDDGKTECVVSNKSL